MDLSAAYLRGNRRMSQHTRYQLEINSPQTNIHMHSHVGRLRFKTLGIPIRVGMSRACSICIVQFIPHILTGIVQVIRASRRAGGRKGPEDAWRVDALPISDTMRQTYQFVANDNNHSDVSAGERDATNRIPHFGLASIGWREWRGGQRASRPLFRTQSTGSCFYRTPRTQTDGAYSFGFSHPDVHWTRMQTHGTWLVKRVYRAASPE